MASGTVSFPFPPCMPTPQPRVFRALRRAYYRQPSHKSTVTPFVVEKFPDVFREKTGTVLVLDSERTFWEKLTLLQISRTELRLTHSDESDRLLLWLNDCK